MDRAAHTELLDDAGTDAADLVSGDLVTGGTAQASGLHLNGVGFLKRHRKRRIGESAAGGTLLIIAPLPGGERRELQP